MIFSREAGADKLFAEMMPLLNQHYVEVAHYQDIKLDPDFEKYAQLEQIGMLRFFTARDETGMLRGYAVFFVKENLHYKASLQASQDVIFIDPTIRGAGFGKSFINYCDDELRKEGVQAVYHHVKNAHNFGPMLETLNYELIDLIYAKRLDVNHGC